MSEDNERQASAVSDVDASTERAVESEWHWSVRDYLIFAVLLILLILLLATMLFLIGMPAYLVAIVLIGTAAWIGSKLRPSNNTGSSHPPDAGDRLKDEPKLEQPKEERKDAPKPAKHPVWRRKL